MTKYPSIIFALCAPLVVLAFWPLYLSRPFGTIDGFTHFHAVMGSLWFVLLIAQPLLIHYRCLRIHRALGRCTYVVAPLFLLAGTLLSHHRLTAMSDETFAIEGYSHYLPFYANVVFALAYGLGVYYRHIPKAHGRLMLLTVIPLIDPVIGRVIFFYFPGLPSPSLYQALTFSLGTIIAGLLVFSYRGNYGARRALVTYFILLVGLEIGWFTVAHTTTWLASVSWFRSLALS